MLSTALKGLDGFFTQCIICSIVGVESSTFFQENVRLVDPLGLAFLMLKQERFGISFRKYTASPRTGMSCEKSTRD